MSRESYFDWLISFVDDGQNILTHKKLLSELFDTEFYWTVPLDKNRANDGLGLRSQYVDSLPKRIREREINELDGACSILEMMVALSSRMEHSIMFNTAYGDRTAIWFWMMIENLQLLSFVDNRYDHVEVGGRLVKFLQRSYSSDGRGGLFWIPDTKHDMRKPEIWYQMNWWVDYLLDQ